MPRADATRNRAALIEAARRAFTDEGDASLDGIARAAGVGIGTLYRHFPTRQDLIAAVYAAELDAVIDSADRLRERGPADAAFRRWLDRYAAFSAAKRGMAEALHAGAFTAAAESARTRERVRATVAAFLRAGAEQGAFRDDVEAEDVTAAIVGVFLTTRDAPDPGQAARLLDLLIDGLRPRAR